MIYDNVKAIAETKGYTIASLEKAAGLSNGTIGKWQVSSPNIENLLKVARTLHVTVNTLVKPARED